MRKFVAPCLLACASAFGAPNVLAGAYDDCILSGMKGVSSDAASRMVAKACANKIDEAHDAAVQREFGSALPAQICNLATNYEILPDGRKHIRISNNSPSQTITYVELILRDADFYDFEKAHPEKANEPLSESILTTAIEKPKWESDRTHRLHYKLTLGPLKSTSVIFQAKDGPYIEVGAVRGREKKWTDGMSSNANPVSPEKSDPTAPQR